MAFALFLLSLTSLPLSQSLSEVKSGDAPTVVCAQMSVLSMVSEIEALQAKFNTPASRFPQYFTTAMLGPVRTVTDRRLEIDVIFVNWLVVKRWDRSWANRDVRIEIDREIDR